MGNTRLGDQFVFLSDCSHEPNDTWARYDELDLHGIMADSMYFDHKVLLLSVMAPIWHGGRHADAPS